MAIVRLEALRGLKARIECKVPELVGAICVGQADSAEDLVFPSLNIDPVRWRYNPHQAQDVRDAAPDRIVSNVGYHNATIQLRINAKNSYERADLEQKVLDLFLSNELRPGILLTNIVSCPDLADFVAAWEFDEDEWEDGGAFSNQFESVLAINGVIPALVTYGSVHTIEQLLLGITHDMSTVFTAVTFDTSADVEVVEINQDGTITAVP